jgi:hypothetical protein
MGITIELSPEVEALLQADAEAQGRKPEEIAAERLSALYLTEAEAARQDFDAWYASLSEEEHAAEIAAVRQGLTPPRNGGSAPAEAPRRERIAGK